MEDAEEAKPEGNGFVGREAADVPGVRKRGCVGGGAGAMAGLWRGAGSALEL